MVKIKIESQKHGDVFVIVDKEDVPLVSGYTWYQHRRRKKDTIYAKSGRDLMHRVIMGLIGSEYHCDHIDGNGLNNTRANLRRCIRSENLGNQKIKEHRGLPHGVDKHKEKYRARISVHNKQIRYNVTANVEDAAYFYDWMARIVHGEFATQNFTNKKSFTVGVDNGRI